MTRPKPTEQELNFARRRAFENLANALAHFRDGLDLLEDAMTRDGQVAAVVRGRVPQIGFPGALAIVRCAVLDLQGTAGKILRG